jgi:hypothetical protein
MAVKEHVRMAQNTLQQEADHKPLIFILIWINMNPNI